MSTLLLKYPIENLMITCRDKDGVRYAAGAMWRYDGKEHGFQINDVDAPVFGASTGKVFDELNRWARSVWESEQLPVRLF